MKDVHPDTGNNTIVEDVHPKIPVATVVNVDPMMAVDTKINDEEVSMTEKVDSDSAYNIFGSNNCGVS